MLDLLKDGTWLKPGLRRYSQTLRNDATSNLEKIGKPQNCNSELVWGLNMGEINMALLMGIVLYQYITIQ